MLLLLILISLGVPHTRGDEPVMTVYITGIFSVFPTPVGMNRHGDINIKTITGVPHTRGDEPSILAVGTNQDKCSPHPWG